MPSNTTYVSTALELQDFRSVAFNLETLLQKSTGLFLLLWFAAHHPPAVVGRCLAIRRPPKVQQINREAAAGYIYNVALVKYSFLWTVDEERPNAKLTDGCPVIVGLRCSFKAIHQHEVVCIRVDCSYTTNYRLRSSCLPVGVCNVYFHGAGSGRARFALLSFTRQAFRLFQ